MQVPVSNRTLLRSLMAGTLVLLGANACSRSDRTESGSNDNAATVQDTAVTRATQDLPGTGQDRMAIDTANPTSENTGTGAAAGDTAPASVKSNAPRAATATSSAERKETSGAGNRPMERDTAALPESDSARVTEDTSETSMNQGDTADVAGYSEMARDTTGGVDQIDTTGNAAAGAEAGDTTMNAGRVRPIEDSTETMGQVTTDTNATLASDTLAGDAAIAARGADTTGNAGRIRPPEDSTEMQANAADTAADAAAGADAQDTTMNAGRVRPIEDSTETMGQVTTDDNAAVASDTLAGDAAIAARGADTTGNAGRIRPPEDSTEMQGNVSSAESESVNAADTADEAPVPAEARKSDTGEGETQVASENQADAVGAASMAGTVTGADAVAMMTRAGERCHVVDPESDEEVRWDMSSTPSTLNPCGLGSMVWTKVWMENQ